MEEKEFYRNKITESAGEIQSVDRLRKLYTIADALHEHEKKERTGHDKKNSSPTS